jgi:hypothetical protein
LRGVELSYIGLRWLIKVGGVADSLVRPTRLYGRLACTLRYLLRRLLCFKKTSCSSALQLLAVVAQSCLSAIEMHAGCRSRYIDCFYQGHTGSLLEFSLVGGGLLLHAPADGPREATCVSCLLGSSHLTSPFVFASQAKIYSCHCDFFFPCILVFQFKLIIVDDFRNPGSASL